LLQVFDYVVDNESHTFVKWTDIIPAYTGSPHKGLPPDAYVHVPSNEVWFLITIPILVNNNFYY